jgi:hypothetical protein
MITNFDFDKMIEYDAQNIKNMSAKIPNPTYDWYQYYSGL